MTNLIIVHSLKLLRICINDHYTWNAYDAIFNVLGPVPRSYFEKFVNLCRKKFFGDQTHVCSTMCVWGGGVFVCVIFLISALIFYNLMLNSIVAVTSRAGADQSAAGIHGAADFSRAAAAAQAPPALHRPRG